MQREYKIKIVFNSTKTGLTTVEEEFRKDINKTNVVKNVSVSHGVDSFPTASLEINATSKYPNLISIKSGDIVTIYHGEIGESFEKTFKGVLLSVSVKTVKENFKLIIECVSPFYFLQKNNLNSSNFKNTFGFREILNELIAYCGINEKIEIDKNVPNEFKLQSLNNFPALSFINAICYELDLVYDFNIGDIMKISKKSDVINKMRASIPIVLNSDQIISSEFKQ